MTVAILETNSLTWTDKEINFIKEYYCKNCTDNEFTHFLHVCISTGLDPRRNQIHPIVRGKEEKRKLTIQTGIDGYRLIAERTRKYAPGREPSYTYDSLGQLASATAYVKKLTPDGTWHEVSATAFWKEYAVYYNDKPADFWKKMPHNQLAKCAEALALRKAFPADLSGILTDEEMEQAKNLQSDNKDIINITPEPQTPEIEKADMSLNEVRDWIQKNYPHEIDNFLIWLEEVRKKQDWAYEKCITQFKINPKITLDRFQSWLMIKVGL